MSDTIWIDSEAQLPALSTALAKAPWIGVDTEFLREKTFFPKLCLLQLATADGIWCVDTLRIASLAPLVAALNQDGTLKILHAARQDLEALFLATRKVIKPVFDTQIAAACIGMKPQLGYAELAKTLIGVDIAKSQTRTDWSRRPLSAAQLAYAADDVEHLHGIATRLQQRLRELGREEWVTEDCRQLENSELYDADPARAWTRLKNLAQLPPPAIATAQALGVWRERLAREQDLPRAWVLQDFEIFEIAVAQPRDLNELIGASGAIAKLPESAIPGLLQAVLESREKGATRESLVVEPRPSVEQKALLNRLARIVELRARELDVSAELLAPRGELKSLALGKLQVPVLTGWRRAVIGDSLVAAL
jgi:ribonuclease D